MGIFLGLFTVIFWCGVVASISFVYSYLSNRKYKKKMLLRAKTDSEVEDANSIYLFDKDMIFTNVLAALFCVLFLVFY